MNYPSESSTSTLAPTPNTTTITDINIPFPRLVDLFLIFYAACLLAALPFAIIAGVVYVLIDSVGVG